MRFFLACVVTGVAVAGAAGCSHPQAQTRPEMPALEVPAAPERTIAPPLPEEPPPPDVPEAPERKPVRPRPSSPPKAEQPPPVAPPAAQASAPPAGALQTAPPATQAEVVKTVRDLLARAQRDLKSVKYEGLNADGKAQYDTARRFIDEAELALKEQNLPFALTLADKAATLGRSLAGR